MLNIYSQIPNTSFVEFVQMISEVIALCKTCVWLPVFSLGV